VGVSESADGGGPDSRPAVHGVQPAVVSGGGRGPVYRAPTPAGPAGPGPAGKVLAVPGRCVPCRFRAGPPLPPPPPPPAVRR
jgi:hypothetical protein